MKQYLTFHIDGQNYGFPIQKVREINLVGDVTKVPNAANYNIGVINLRGSLISVVSLRLKMGLPVLVGAKNACIVVVESGERQIGVLVDAVNSVINIEESLIENNSATQAHGNYVEGLAKLDKAVIILIDIESCFFTQTNGQSQDAA